jgi:hypothetical protein
MPPPSAGPSAGAEFDPAINKPIEYGQTAEQIGLATPSSTGRSWDAAEWVFAIVVLIVIGKTLKALGRGAKHVSKAATQVAIDVAPGAKRAASRIGTEAASRAKNFIAETRKCPHCAELIKKDATVCRHCHQHSVP